MEYYTNKAYEKIVNKFSYLEGGEYFFEESSSEKHKVFKIEKQPRDETKDEHRVIVSSIVGEIKQVLIVDFMRFNKIDFDYNNYKDLH